MSTLCDPAAERAVLSGIFAHGNEAYIDVADIVTPRTFTIDSNDVIYRCLEYVLQEYPEARPDVPSILSAARTLGVESRFEHKEEMKYLRAVMNMDVKLPNVRKFAAKIRKLEIAKLMDEQLEDVQGQLHEITGDESSAHIVGLVQNPVLDFTSLLSDTETKGVVPMGRDALQFVQHVMDNPCDKIGIPTGFDLWDMLVGGGVRPGGLDIWAARQKTGKTFLVDNIAYHVVTGGGGKFEPLPVLNVDLEMEQTEHWPRILALMTGLKVTNIEKGLYANDAASRHKLEDAAKRLEDLPYDYLCARGMDIEDILAYMRRWLIRRVGRGPNGKAKPCLIIYDWLKLTSQSQLSGNLKEYQLLSFITSGLKNFMGRYGASCLCFAQLNREGIEYEDTRVIRGSDAILDFCTSFTLYKWKSDAEMGEEIGNEVKYTHKLIPILGRFGPGLKSPDYINIAADYEHGRIVEGPTARGQGQQAKRPKGEFVVDDSATEDDIPFSSPDEAA